MRAAVLHGPGDVRVGEVAEPEGEVLVRICAASACAIDRAALEGGRRRTGPYPALFGHEMAGERGDTGERVLVSDSLPCGSCASCLDGATNLCRNMTWLSGGFAERIGVPAAALHPMPDGLPFAAAVMAQPLASCIHAVGRGTQAAEALVIGGGAAGLMLARLLVLDGRVVTVLDPRPERRAQADDAGARGVERSSGRAPLVFETVGRPETWRLALDRTAPGGTAVLAAGCRGRDEVTLPAGRLHDEEVDVHGAFHHTPAEVDEALMLLSNGAVDWWALATPTIGLAELGAALRAPAGGPARKLIVDPRR
jgi:L-iditol 2-dehydrogenase